MIVTCVNIHVKPETVDSFIYATIRNHRRTVKETGNIRFDFVQQADDPCRFMLYEVFDSAEAVELHKTTEHYLEWRDTVAEFMADPRNGVRYNIIEPSDKTRW